MYDYGDIEFAMCGVRILALILVIALVAFIAKSRALFVAGLLGCFLGYVVPEAEVYPNGTGEQIYMGRLARSAEHVLWHGAVGAAICAGAVAALQKWAERLPRQFTLRTLLLVMTAVALLAAAIRVLML